MSFRPAFSRLVFRFLGRRTGLNAYPGFKSHDLSDVACRTTVLPKIDGTRNATRSHVRARSYI